MLYGGVLAGAVLVVGGTGLTAGAAGHPSGPGLPSADAVHPLTAAAAVTAGDFDLEWSVRLQGGTIAQSSPIVATIGGTPAVVVGSLDGKVYALRLSNGVALSGWPATDPGAVPIQSTPSISGTTIYVGTGDAGHPTSGGYLALGPGGGRLWYKTVPATPANHSPSGVQASLAVGTLQGTRTVIAGALGQYEEELGATSGAVMSGFPWFAADSEFSTPSIANLYGNGHNYIVEGGESTYGNAYGVQYYNGGHIRILSAAGQNGHKEPSGGLVCQYDTTQGVESSPAVGNFLASGAKGIVVGTGNTYKTATDSDKLFAIGTHCGLRWKATLDGSTLDSPALVDALGNGGLQVAEGTSTGPDTGTVYLLDGANGRTLWSRNVGGQVIGGITSADLGSGYQDLLVPTTGGLDVIDGRTGALVALLGHGALGLQSSPLITEDADGTIGITVAGYNAHGGMIIHWAVARSPGALSREAGAWPMFHHDPQLTGTTITAAAR